MDRSIASDREIVKLSSMSDSIISRRDADECLVQDLYEKVKCRPSKCVDGISYRNVEVASWLEEKLSVKELFTRLSGKGAFDLNTESILWVDIDGEEKKLIVNRASQTHMWPMGTNYWVRDNAIIGARLMQVDPKVSWYCEERFKLGRSLLLSSVTVLSSCSQLRRFEEVISGSVDYRNPHAWPHIFLDLESNINASEQELWMHKQDAWQIAFYYLLEAIEKEWVLQSELSEKQSRVLELIVPFLDAIDYSSCENGGSWEEVAAVRSSVVCWDLALLLKIRDASWVETDRDVLHCLISKGRERLSSSIPFESPHYEKKDVRYREADSALIYLLLLDIFPFIDIQNADVLRKKTIESIESLVGLSGAKRYVGDSYQGLSYYTNTVSSKLSELYDSPSGDSSGQEAFAERGKIVPKGQEAQWTHFIWQLSSVFGQLFTRCGDFEYKEKQEYYFHLGLSLFTGEGEYSLQEGIDEMEVFSIPPFRMPECYNSEIYEKEIFLYPSLHTPLYWSVAECMAAFSQMES